MKKTCLFLTAILLMLALPCVAETHSFSREEIPMLPEADASVVGLCALGILQGTEKGLELDRSVTRAEVLTFIQRTVLPEAKNTSQAVCPFTDIGDHWAKETIISFYHMGLVNGTTESTYTPDRQVSGKEFAKIMLTAMGYAGITIENAYEKSRETELVINNYTGSAVNLNLPLLRGDAVRLCFSALTAKNPDGEMLYKTRIKKGVNEETDFEGVLYAASEFPSETPEPPKGSESMKPITDALAAVPDGGFAAGLNNALSGRYQQNHVISPFSVKMAIGLAANGAEGEALRELLQTCSIDDLQVFGENTRQSAIRYAGDENVQLFTANGIFVNTDQIDGTFDEDYCAKISAHYGAKAETVTTESATEKINRWAAENTGGKITYLTADGAFAAALMSAASFVGEWETPFPTEDSYRDVFYGPYKTEYEADYMQKTHIMPYYENNSIQMVELPYRSERENVNLSMVVIMDKSSYTSPAGNPYFVLQNAVFTMQNVHLTMPKFEISFVENLLSACGLQYSAAKGFAEFKSMMPDAGLYLSRLMHRAYIKVDEGTGTLPASMVEAGQTAIEMKVDHTFCFLVRDNDTGEILFIGEYRFGQ